MTLFYNRATKFSLRIPTSTVVLVRAVVIQANERLPRLYPHIARGGAARLARSTTFQISPVVFEKSARTPTKLLKFKRRRIFSTFNVQTLQYISQVPGKFQIPAVSVYREQTYLKCI